MNKIDELCEYRTHRQHLITTTIRYVLGIGNDYADACIHAGAKPDDAQFYWLTGVAKPYVWQVRTNNKLVNDPAEYEHRIVTEMKKTQWGRNHTVGSVMNVISDARSILTDLIIDAEKGVGIPTSAGKVWNGNSWRNRQERKDAYAPLLRTYSVLDTQPPLWLQVWIEHEMNILTAYDMATAVVA